MSDIAEVEITQIKSAPTDLKRVLLAPDTKAFRDDLAALVQKHAKTDPRFMLATASHVVGTTLALQDRSLTPVHCNKIIAANIGNGYQAALAGVGIK